MYIMWGWLVLFNDDAMQNAYVMLCDVMLLCYVVFCYVMTCYVMLCYKVPDIDTAGFMGMSSPLNVSIS